MNRLTPAALIIAALALTACGGGGSGSSGASEPSGSTGSAGSSGGSASGSLTDACTMITAADLHDAIGGDWASGAKQESKTKGSTCLFGEAGKTSLRMALLQTTTEADTYFPKDGPFPVRQDGSQDVPGATRGFVSPHTVEGISGTVFVVKDKHAALLTISAALPFTQDDEQKLAAKILGQL